MEDIGTKEFLDYVKNAIQKFGEIGKLVRKGQVHPEEINYALAMYMETSLILNAEYQRIKMIHLDLEEDYKRWYDEKFDEAKERVIQEYKANGTTTKPNLKEIEIRLRNYYRKQYDDYQKKLKVANAEVRFLLRVLETYKKYDNILTNLSQNMRSEMKALSLENRVNAGSAERSPVNKVRSRFPASYK